MIIRLVTDYLDRADRVYFCSYMSVVRWEVLCDSGYKMPAARREKIVRILELSAVITALVHAEIFDFSEETTIFENQTPC